MLTRDQLKEREEWGKSKDGYVAGGNYDDDPNLKKFTIKSYQKLKELGRVVTGPEGSALKRQPDEYQETTSRQENDLSAIRGQIKSKITQSRKNMVNRSVFDSVNNSMLGGVSQHDVIQSFIEPAHA